MMRRIRSPSLVRFAPVIRFASVDRAFGFDAGRTFVAPDEPISEGPFAHVEVARDLRFREASIRSSATRFLRAAKSMR